MKPTVVYSNNTCPNCDNLKKALTFKGIAFQEINISDNPSEGEKIRSMGYRTLPVMEHNGEWLNGFTMSNLSKIVQSHQAVA